MSALTFYQWVKRHKAAYEVGIRHPYPLFINDWLGDACKDDDLPRGSNPSKLYDYMTSIPSDTKAPESAIAAWILWAYNSGKSTRLPKRILKELSDDVLALEENLNEYDLQSTFIFQLECRYRALNSGWIRRDDDNLKEAEENLLNSIRRRVRTLDQIKADKGHAQEILAEWDRQEKAHSVEQA